MATSRFTSKFADRGQVAEKAVQKYLDAWQSRSPRREYERLVDTKAAGRVIKAASADFAFYSNDGMIARHGLIEVKETEHEYRLGKDRISQLPRLRKRAQAGGLCVVLVFHSKLDVWRWLDAKSLIEWGDKGSWNMTEIPTHKTPGEALADFTGGVFG